jgi:hypothetical protein
MEILAQAIMMHIQVDVADMIQVPLSQPQLVALVVVVPRLTRLNIMQHRVVQDALNLKM